MKYLSLFALTLFLSFHSFGFQAETSRTSLDKGRIAFDQENWALAQTYLDQWLQTHPADQEAYWLRGQAYQQQGKLEQALTDFSSLLSLNPLNSEALFERGRVRYLLRQFDGAISDFENFLKTPPSETTRVVYRIGPGESGVSAVSTAQSGNQDQAYYHLGLCSIALEEYDFAILYLDEAIAINPSEPDFFAEKGRALTRIGDNVPAMESFELALQLDPDHLPAKEGLALVKTGGDEILLQQIEQVIADSVANSQTYKQRGFYRMNHQDEEGALKDFTIAIAMDSLDSESFFYRGKVYAKQKKWDLSEADYSAAVTLEPQNPEYFLARGQARYTSGKVEAALADFTMTINQDPEYASGWYHRGISYQRLGKIKEACSDLLKAKEMGMEAAEAAWKKVCGGG